MKVGTRLPPKCPENIVYWNKCETRVESQRLITAKQILDFQKKKVVQFNEEEDIKKRTKVMDKFPFMKDMQCWSDP